jgi:hypothetical protein
MMLDGGASSLGDAEARIRDLGDEFLSIVTSPHPRVSRDGWRVAFAQACEALQRKSAFAAASAVKMASRAGSWTSRSRPASLLKRRRHPHVLLRSATQCTHKLSMVWQAADDVDRAADSNLRGDCVNSSGDDIEERKQRKCEEQNRGDDVMSRPLPVTRDTPRSQGRARYCYENRRFPFRVDDQGDAAHAG